MVQKSRWLEAQVLRNWLASVGTAGEVPVGASGAWIHSAGRRFFDAGSYGLSFFGHAHPRILQAVSAQLGSFAWSSRCLPSPIGDSAAQSLADKVGEEADCVQFFSTGAEAADAVIRLVAARAGRAPRLLTVRGNFHGLTVGALAVSGRALLRRASRLDWEIVEVDWRNADAVLHELAAHPVDAAFLEPVQGEAGVVFPPGGFLPGLARVVRAGGGLVVLDEIQVGLGRLGCYWAKELEALPWDALLVGKALGGGVVPVSALVCGAELGEVARGHSHLLLTTFGGNPLAAAAVTAALGVLDDDQLVQRAAQIGRTVAHVLEQRGVAAAAGVIAIRGLGTLWGIELANPRLAASAIRRTIERGVLVARPVLTEKVLRIAIPAVVSDDDAAWAADMVAGSVLEAVEEETRERRTA